MPTLYQNTIFNPNDLNNPTYNITGIPLKTSRKGLPEVALKHDSVSWDFLFLGLSILVGVLTEGLGDIIFASILAGTELTEGVATIIAGSVQTFFEVAGQLGINVLSGRTSKTAIIASILPGLGVFGFGKIYKGIKLLRNEKLLFTTLIKNGITKNVAKDLTYVTKEFLVGENLSDNLFLNAIKNQDLDSVNTVRTFREKIYRSSGIGVNKKVSGFYKAMSKKYEHETIDDIPSLIDKRLSKQYDIKWKYQTLEKRLLKLFGKQWYEQQMKKNYIEDLSFGLEQFKLNSLRKNETWFNKTINKPRNLYKFKRTDVETKKQIGIEIKTLDKATGKWKKIKSYFNQENETNLSKNTINNSESIEKIFKVRKSFLPKLVKEKDRPINYLFRTIRKSTSPLRLIKPSNALRYVDRKIAKKIEKWAIEKQWFKRILEQINKVTKHTRQLDLQLIKRFNLIPAIDSKWMIGFRLINGSSIFVEIFYRNNATNKIVVVQRELYPEQFERMLVAFETGNAGEFYNRELALGWGLKKSWTNDILFASASKLKIQSYLYSSWYAYRNIKSFSKGISAWENHKYSQYPWKKNIEDYGKLRVIRSFGSLLGLGWITAGLGVSLYRGKGFTLGLTNSFTRRVRTSIRRYKRKPYHKPKKRRFR